MKGLPALALALAALMTAGGSSASGPIDLDVPGKLEAIERDNPGHFAKIERILAEVPRQPPNQKSVAEWMRTQFRAQDVQYSDLVMTSLPPKKRLRFSLDDTSYVKIVTLNWQARVTPAFDRAGRP
jgi:hypothetical protein